VHLVDQAALKVARDVGLESLVPVVVAQRAARKPALKVVRDVGLEALAVLVVVALRVGLIATEVETDPATKKRSFRPTLPRARSEGI
jgi:hypothetical protein